MNLWRKCFVVLLLIISGSVYADPPWDSTYWWHDLTQRDRNQDIVDATARDLNKKVGISCKEWVRSVVNRATENHVAIPANQSSPYDYMWKNDSSGHVVALSMPIENVSPGHIVQMKLSGNIPHTAIVLAKSKTTTSTKITFIESNWDSTPYVESDAYVKTRTVTTTQFYSKLVNPGAYTVYFVQ